MLEYSNNVNKGVIMTRHYDATKEHSKFTHEKKQDGKGRHPNKKKKEKNPYTGK